MRQGEVRVLASREAYDVTEQIERGRVKQMGWGIKSLKAVHYDIG